MRLALLWMGVAFVLAVLPFLLLAVRRAIFGSPRTHNRDARSTSGAGVDAWSEAERRIATEPGADRLDDTVDLDPFGPSGDGPW